MRPAPLPPNTAPSSARSSSTCPVAETMTRVHAELRAGRAPSFEAMLAYGVPEATASA